MLQESAHRWLDEYLHLKHMLKTDKRKLRKLMNLEQVPADILMSNAVESLRTRLAQNLQKKHDLRDNSGLQVLPLGHNLRKLVARRETQRISLLNLQAQALQQGRSGATSVGQDTLL